MGIPVVVGSSGLPVTIASNGASMEVASNGFGLPIVIVSSGGFPAFVAGLSNSTYTLTAARGLFTITGMDANLIASHNPLVAAAGAFSITGIDAALTYSGSGLTGQPMGLLLTLTYS